MTQFHSAPATAGPEHRVGPTALAVHIASANSWGRPWRRRALSLPALRTLTFQGIRLPVLPLRSWLHMLSRAGMLGRRPSVANPLIRPMDDEDVPPKIDELAFELASEMVLDFAEFARLSRLKSEAEQGPADAEEQMPEAHESPTAAAKDEAAPLHALGMAGSVPSESVDRDFLGLDFSLSEGPSVQQTQDDLVEAIAPEGQVGVPIEQPAFDTPEPIGSHAMDSPETEIMIGLKEPVAAEEFRSENFACASSQEVELPDVAVPDLSEAADTVELSAPGMEEGSSSPVVESPESEGSEQHSVRELVEQPQLAAADFEAQQMEMPEVVELPVPESAMKLPPLEVTATDESVDGQAVESLQPEIMEVPEVREVSAPAIAVTNVRIARKSVEPPNPIVTNEPSVQRADAPAMVAASVPIVAGDIEQPLPEGLEVVAAQDVDEPENAAVAVAATEVVADPSLRDATEISAVCGADTSTAVMQQATVEPVQPPDLTCDSDGLGAERIIASLDDSLAVLVAANGNHDEALFAQVEPSATPPVPEASCAPHAAEARLADGNNLEAAVLQGTLIQKETEMTQIHDELSETEAQDTTIPITSVELQEVAAVLSVPQLDANPDDVLSDVQSTLNSLAGMAQGLTQQKQAAGRLQEELEEWSSQLQERERLAADKEERLLQLENHLKEAKLNLDRMAAENNRLLAERSEALKELAQTVDLRDKTTLKRAESVQLEQQRIDEQLASLRARSNDLDERESALKRKSEELGVRLKQLQSAKDKFSTIVKSFNETVQFNSTLSAISKTVNE